MRGDRYRYQKIFHEGTLPWAWGNGLKYTDPENFIHISPHLFELCRQINTQAAQTA